MASQGTRYVELHIVNDYARTTDIGIDFVADDALTIVNTVEAFFSTDGVAAGLDYDIRLAVVGQDAFVDEDPWTGRGTVGESNGEVDYTDLIDEFTDWVRACVSA